MSKSDNMTDETRDQISRDAEDWCDEMLQSEEDFDRYSFESGATWQHPISFSQGERAGREKAIDDVIALYNIWDPYQEGDKEDPFRKELEKLKL